MFFLTFAQVINVKNIYTMQNSSGLLTKDGKSILTYDIVERMRAVEDEKRKKKELSRTFISQKGAQEYVQHSAADLDGTGGNRGGGKANTYSTPVATPTGFRKMGDLQVGDAICTPYNGVQEVSNIFEQGEHTIYHFFFDDGTKVSCMDNHRFWARTSPTENFKMMTAREIMNRYKLDAPFPLSLRGGITDYVEIPLCGEVELNESKKAIDLPLHPFMLGFISCTGYWKFGVTGIKLSQDPFLIRCFHKYGYRITKNKRDGFYYLRGLSDENRHKFTYSRNAQPAQIPQEYMTASVAARYEYLRGIFYKGGRSIHKHPTLILPNKKLIEQCAEMGRSLGMWCHVDQVQDIPEKIGYWRCIFIAPDDSVLWWRSVMKKSAQKHTPGVPTSPNDQTMLTKKLQYIRKSKDKQPCRCITVTGRDHLYMTDGYTINHNTAMLLTKPLPDIHNRFFNGIILRKNKKDFDNIITEIDKWYEPLGKYNKSADDMTFYFKSGAHMSLTHFDMSEQAFDDRVRGQQYAYIGIDEVTQISFEWFKKLMRSNRNTNNIKSRMLFTCNPDPLSWFRKWIDWYIGKADTIYADGKMHPERKGLVIPERSGKIRYFYSPDDIVDNTIWGNSPHEVYLQIKDIADAAWDDNLAQHGLTRENFMVKSFRFTKADLMDNKALMDLDPDYYKNLLQAPPEIRERELGGNWDIIKTGDDMIQPFHLDRIFHNAQILGDRVRRASCDVAGSGGDNCVTWFKIGNHVQDVYVCRKDPYSTVPLIRAKLREWGVLEQNFTYDLQGMGQLFTGAFPNAVPFNNQEACDGDDRKLYDCRKSQAAYLFAQHTQQGEWSIEPSLLDREYQIGGVQMRLYNILQLERKAIRQDMTKEDRGWCLIHKEQMKNKSLVGHSPDFIESLMMFEIFDIDGPDTEIPSFLTGHIQSVRTFETN